MKKIAGIIIGGVFILLGAFLLLIVFLGMEDAFYPIGLIAIGLGSYIIFKAVHSTQYKNELDAKAAVSLSRQKKMILVMNIAKVIGFIIIVSFVYTNNFILLIAGIIIFGIAEIMTMKSKAKMKTIASENIVSDVVKEAFDHPYYNYNQGLPEEMIRNINFQISYDTIRSSDYIKANYQNTIVQIANTELIKITIERHENEMINKEVAIEYSQFKGLWICCDFQKKLPASFILIKKKRSLLKSNKGNLQTGNEQFDHIFDLYTENQYETLNFLTSAVMKKLIDLSSKVDSPLYISYHQDGNVVLAINDEYQRFETGNSSDVNKLRQKFKEEIYDIKENINQLIMIDEIADF